MQDTIKRVVTEFLESKYGPVKVELTRIYRRDGEVEVAGTFTRPGESRLRRFTAIVDKYTLNVKAFGMR